MLKRDAGVRREYMVVDIGQAVWKFEGGGGLMRVVMVVVEICAADGVPA